MQSPIQLVTRRKTKVNCTKLWHKLGTNHKSTPKPSSVGGTKSNSTRASTQFWIYVTLQSTEIHGKIFRISVTSWLFGQSSLPFHFRWKYNFGYTCRPTPYSLRTHAQARSPCKMFRIRMNFKIKAVQVLLFCPVRVTEMVRVEWLTDVILQPVCVANQPTNHAWKVLNFFYAVCGGATVHF